jgi:hypothetical protein
MFVILIYLKSFSNQDLFNLTNANFSISTVIFLGLSFSVLGYFSYKSFYSLNNII